ncbi:tRNA pseudouridine(38-40) synthase TruA [Fictibacillus enclensis]|uniref:tRNA pseudouridine(38-40) synthase TruA n=1 Tax=Fictibacillus enclensis TaxID=1017270 RepID=UPI00259FE987|nr:tRNA pseudouridine(38-40) synthase TruA [Fictibacillus enclensis]MDM5196930.1 tRNA pseudouridine(38-40) synthase TruA [Fictibacillus enclensis]
MQRWKATVSYDGTQFAGYQVQPGARTVQGEIEKSLSKMHKGTSVRISASGRTDAGVHALGQVLHFDSPLAIVPERWQKAVNALLPADIRILEVEAVPFDFHARFSAVEKEYHYRLMTSGEPDVFRRNYASHFPYPLDHTAIQEAMGIFMGTHDFTSFSSARSEVEDKVRTITMFELVTAGDELIFKVRGNGFLYNMVRIMAGTLLDAGQGKIQPEEIRSMLAEKDRSAAGKTAPPHGLYLYRVTY